MILEYIESLRKKPKHVREQYAFGATALFMTLVIGVWSLSLPNRLANVAGEVSEVQPAATAPFSHFFSQFKEQFKSDAPSPVAEVNIPPTPEVPATEMQIDADFIAAQAALTAASTTATTSSTTSEVVVPARTIMIGTSTATTTAE